MTNNTAKTILQQIRAGTEGHNPGTTLMMCWGTHNMTAVSETDGRQGLMFKVNGALFKGYVRVILEWNDTYSVEFVTYRRPRRNLKKGDFAPKAPVRKVKASYSDVYCDQLTGLIDGTVEKA